MTYKCKSYAFR